MTTVAQTVAEILANQALKNPDAEALIFPELSSRLSFLELEEAVDSCARGLSRLGIRKGDRVALWLPNLPEWVVAFFSLAKLGAPVVTINAFFRRREVEYLLKQSRSRALILSRGNSDVDYVSIAKEMMPELQGHDPMAPLSCASLPNLHHAVFVGEESPEGMFNYKRLQSLGRDFRPEAAWPQITSADLATIQYTSGTTGFPKGAMLSHGSIVKNAHWVGQIQSLSSSDRVCAPVPFFHCFGSVMAVLGAYSWGAAVVSFTSFDEVRVLEAIQNERCTSLYGVPMMFLAELIEPTFSNFSLASLRTGIMAGAFCPATLVERVVREMHIPELTVAYGLTEAAPVVTMTDRHDPLGRKCTTVGKPLPEIEIKVVDEGTGQALPNGKIGEVLVHGYSVMQGYWDDPVNTREALTDDGWLRTGDLGTIDGDGYLAIGGRRKDVIIRGGENIYPKEIEEFLRTFPQIADVVVYGVPNKLYGEEVAAAIRLKPGASAEPNEIIDFCREQIAYFKVPRYIQFVSHFPQTATWKTQKFKLKERAFEDFPTLREESEGIPQRRPH